jgi:hypothetical protein
MYLLPGHACPHRVPTLRLTYNPPVLEFAQPRHVPVNSTQQYKVEKLGIDLERFKARILADLASMVQVVLCGGTTKSTAAPAFRQYNISTFIRFRLLSICALTSFSTLRAHISRLVIA